MYTFFYGGEGGGQTMGVVNIEKNILSFVKYSKKGGAGGLWSGEPIVCR